MALGDIGSFFGSGGSDAAAGIFSGLSEYFKAAAQARAIRAQGQIEQTFADYNARQATREAEQVLKIGSLEANKARAEAHRFAASQRALLAAQGVDVEVGSAADIVDQSKLIGEIESVTIKNNAVRQAFGLKQQASFLRYQGREARDTARYRSRLTLVTGGAAGAREIFKGFSSQGGGDMRKNQSFQFDPRSFQI